MSRVVAGVMLLQVTHSPRAPARRPPASHPRRDEPDNCDSGGITCLKGTKGHGYYAKYRGGMTVAAAVKAGVPRGYVAWDVAHGFITLKSAA